MVFTDDIINATLAANATFGGIPYKANTTFGEDPEPDALKEHDK